MRNSLILLCLLCCPLAACCAQEKEPLPSSTLRGDLHRDGKGWVLLSDGVMYTLTDPLPQHIDDFDGLNVELKGFSTGDAVPLYQATQVPQVLVPAWWSLPFILLLACIACVPLISKHHWERHYHRVSVGLGLIMVVVYAAFLGRYGQHKMLETGVEYFKFIALIGSLFVVSGGILIDISGAGRPTINTLLLAVGAVLANLFGTTGASALLIRPFLRINKGRLKPFHLVMFIFVVSNCGGVLTPIGDPPLFLGYLYGVPFVWTISHLWPAWLFAVGLLLAVFFVLDAMAEKSFFNTKTQRHEDTKGLGRATDDCCQALDPRPQTLDPKPQALTVGISGTSNFLWLGVVLLGVFLDRILAATVSPALEPYPIGAIAMVLAALAAYRLSKPDCLAQNEFSFGPIKEVAWLFAGIFATMVPALDYLAANAAALGITSPTGFYFGSGVVSSILDNAPTYLNFLSAAHGVAGIPLTTQDMPRFLAQYPEFLKAISLGSVFFGACTYIGNGPNFMVKAIAESHGAPTPGFFGYIFKYALPILVPIYLLVWLLFVR